MIIACPSCGTSYTVEASAFGLRARTVECSSCGERWLQTPATPSPTQSPVVPDDPAKAKAAGGAPVSVTRAALSDEALAPAPPAARPPSAVLAEPPADDSDRSSHLPRSEAATPQPDGFQDPLAEPGAAAPLPTPDATVGVSAPQQAAPAESAGVAATVADGIPPPSDAVAVPEGAPATPPVRAKAAPNRPTAGRALAALQALRRMRRPLLVGGTAAAATLCALGALAIVLRGPVVAMLPAAAGIYEAVGLAADPIGDGLEIRDVTSTRARESGKDVLTVRGVVANVSDGERPLPPLRVSLWNASDEEVQSAMVNQARGRLGPGETATFESRIPGPPPEARSLRVGFSPPQS